MFKTKVYLYDSSEEANGYRGTDYSKYVLQGNENEEDITQEMDTTEITLAGLDFEKEFDPETKLIIDLTETNEFGEDVVVETLHRVVANDTVNQPILSDDEYFDHHISLIEPSVIAQKRLVDNISVTYKLKDVSLQELPAYPSTDVEIITTSSQFTPTETFGVKTVDSYNTKTVWGKYFELEGDLKMVNRQGQESSLTFNDVSFFDVGGNEYYAKFKIPKVAIYCGVKNTTTFRKVGYASIDYKIEEFSLTDSYNPLRTHYGSFISNSSLNLDSDTEIVSYDFNNEWLLEKTVSNHASGTTVDYLDFYFKKYTNISAPTPTYETSEFQIYPDRRYKVSIWLMEFSSNLPSSGEGHYFKYTGEVPTYFCYYNMFFAYMGTPTLIYTCQNSPLISAQVTANGTFTTYDVDTGVLVYSSSTPYSALALLQKAIINSSLYEKKANTYIADINNSDVPFYIDPEFIDELSSSVIIENFYNQKNLWEVMIDVGHYIHAIPELQFGADDKFLITFNKLGITDESTNTSTKVSIRNSKNVEDYLCATSSYITNMVQLGGYIEEWVSAKTTDSTLMISNDTAEIIVSKPIIELLNITVKNNLNGDEANLTPYIYEENVYKTLELDYQVKPNRGIAMYYSLGDNKITGGQYQLPQANTNIYSDYTLKKVIWCAFNGYQAVSPAPISGYWTDVQIKNYSFFVRYRTKDSVRQNHIRPDLRKYLLNSKYDKIPEHNQFNNQTDVVVDSIKFGNNIYGKLIKTGNSKYETTEWNDSYNKIKHKGELYRINGDLYYVAKAKHYRYSTYITSEITYSKDYNELSAVIGIPSEPRFYEISEQSLIWREFAINDVLLLTDKQNQIEYGENYLINLDHLKDLIVGEGTDFAKYAITVFKGDEDITSYDQTVGEATLYKEVITPINAYSSENTLTYEWDMEDNFSAGDRLIDAENYVPAGGNVETKSYNSLKAVGYTDIFGKSALLDFYILGDIGTLTATQIKAQPISPISTKQISGKPFIGGYDILATNVPEYDTNFNGRGIGLLKDCREAISINYNLELATSGDNYVISPYIYLPNKSNIRVVLLNEEVNKISNGYIDNATIITPIDNNGNAMLPYFQLDGTTLKTTTDTSAWDSGRTIVKSFEIDFEALFEDVSSHHFTDTEGYQRVKSIVVLCDVSLNTGESSEGSTLPYKTQFVFARNIPSDWNKNKATSPVYFGAPKKDKLFNNKQ